MDNRPIGVFDSGLGGLTVLKALKIALPNENFIYVGDTARVPYGNKSRKKIKQYSDQISKWLIAQDCKMVVVACNTASAIALESLRMKFSIPIIGVINSGVRRAIHLSQNSHIAVLATAATIKSDEYGKQLKALNSQIIIKNIACPLFVPLVEEGLTNDHLSLSVIRMYLKSLKNSKFDTVILGCTHYPLLKDPIQNVLGDKVKLVDSGNAIVKEVEEFLLENNLMSKISQGIFHCFVTDEPESFDKIAERFLQTKLVGTSHIELF